MTDVIITITFGAVLTGLSLLTNYYYYYLSQRHRHNHQNRLWQTMMNSDGQHRAVYYD